MRLLPALPAAVVVALAAPGLTLGGSALAAPPSAPAASAPATSAPMAPTQMRLSPTEFSFAVALPIDRRRMQQAARAISTPGNPRFRQFLTLEDAAARFGATPAAQRRLTNWAERRGMTVAFDATGLTARVTGSIARWESLYGAEAYAAPGDPAPHVTSYYFADADGTLIATVPASLTGFVRAMIPVYNHVHATASAQVTPPVNKGTPFGPGAECLDDSLIDYTYSPSQLHVPYGTAALHAQGLRGRGTDLAIVALGQSYNPGLAEIAAECFDYRAPEVSVTGGFGMPDAPLPGGVDAIESNLDLQTTAAVLPAASSIGFVEAASGESFIGAIIDGFTTALVRLDPDVITLSYGLCDPLVREAGEWGWRGVADDVFTLGGIVGTSIFVASGDSGSSPCLHNGSDRSGQTSAYPASSPWVTAVGGTRIVLGENNIRVREVVWNDTTWNPASTGSGTGGPSSYAVPWYQASVSPRDVRVIPDVVAHASEVPGWPIVVTPAQYEALVQRPVPPGQDWGMAPVGGTSAASPFSAANVALLAARHGRLGFLNPWLYSVASGSAYDQAFFDVQMGTNQVAPPAGCCKATRGFDLATGLGAPEFAELNRLVR